ncbi:MAG: HD domain-containing protein [Candidatus Micrarchaeota archaeon]|nr:HD domain-containing protein [Candidatus Micrarchaeota archaeon]
MKKKEKSEIYEVLRPGEAIKELLREAAKGESPIATQVQQRLPRLEVLMHNWRLSGVKDKTVDFYMGSSFADRLFYHNIFHTIDVYLSSVLYGELERLPDHKRELLAAAAVFHDLGFIRQYKANEPYGAQIAYEIGKRFEYTEEETKEMQKMILATTMPQQPSSHLERIICDCDLDNLGRPDFFFKGHLVRLELAIFDNKIMSDLQWLEFQMKFLKSHRYHTKSARLLRDELKGKNLEAVSEVVEVMRKRA